MKRVCTERYRILHHASNDPTALRTFGPLVLNCADIDLTRSNKNRKKKKKPAKKAATAGGAEEEESDDE